MSPPAERTVLNHDDSILALALYDRGGLMTEYSSDAPARYSGVARGSAVRSYLIPLQQVLEGSRRVMSWDIFVQDIPKTAQTVGDIPQDVAPLPLGSRADVVRRIQEVVPDVDFSDPSWGTLEGPDFSVELNVGTESSVRCVALHVRGGDAAAGFVADLLLRCGWRAFDPASESGIFDPASATQSLQRWRAYRDRVIRSDTDANEGLRADGRLPRDSGQT